MIPSTFKIDILTLFPDYFESPLGQSVLGRAIAEGRCDVRIIDFRGFSAEKHKKVDDKPFGGGPGMVLSLQPIVDCIEHTLKDASREQRTPRLIITTCRGRTLSQPIIDDYASASVDGLLIVCGHYEDFDARLYELFEFDEISLGDFVLSGGEPVALCIVDALVRKLPGAVGNPESVGSDSFEAGLLDYPSYTRPVEYRGLRVPDVLLAGHHALIEQWRRENALKLTREKRPDLL
ncbi:MAG: tRNA (guanosine(37)-N1)-methyltransferase TrmD, partial [Candidatus Dadabacteria bacterium]|nr:tRNA (guanosine(37)-N1)-methyltransferase TrmD [Candidatus Dadabacteria bacterium]